MQDSVKEWLAGIKMLEEDYVSKFEKAGYKTSDDVEHLKEITEEELEKEIGVKKLGILACMAGCKVTTYFYFSLHLQATGKDSCKL